MPIGRPLGSRWCVERKQVVIPYLSLVDYLCSRRAHRKIVENSFNYNASRVYEPQELNACRRLLRHILNSPENFLDHFRQ